MAPLSVEYMVIQGSDGLVGSYLSHSMYIYSVVFLALTYDFATTTVLVFLWLVGASGERGRLERVRHVVGLSVQPGRRDSGGRGLRCRRRLHVHRHQGQFIVS